MSVLNNAAPDYKGSNPSNTDGQTLSSTVTKIVAKPTFTKKDQAIIFHAVNDLKLLDYVKAVGDMVNPKNITFASRISNNRICIVYLSSKEAVDQLYNLCPFISIDNVEINFCRLIAPSKRIIIYNISPSIPQKVAELAIKDLGFNLTFPISFMKASIPGDDYSYILSFRRQVYIAPPTDNFHLQTSVQNGMLHLQRNGSHCR
ncbi:hypothetical protein ABEB36_008323 [Hypothenemus hampei]|uniref:Uncharacterized protein n=1 Tax=Hypothenemus hampei TaxID=57062 RepID=A0ABD1ELK7_HYPHA